MTTDQNLMLYGKLAGFRLVVVANSFGCDSGFSQELRDRLVGARCGNRADPGNDGIGTTCSHRRG